MKNKLLIILLLLTWLILAFIFAFYDLEISQKIVNRNSGWSMFLQNYGMIPGILIIISGIFVYYSNIKSKTDLLSYVIKVGFFLIGSGLIFHLLEILFDNFITEHLILYLIVSLSIGIITFIVIHKINQVKSQILIKYSKVVVGTAFFGYVIGIQLTKFLWGRVRFRQLDAEFSQFTPWYLPQGITGFDSFPSGHAAMGWVFLSLLILITNEKRWINNFSLIIIILWGITLASSRVIIGAHYSSDVLFGSFFIIFAYLYFNKQSKE